MSLAVMIIITTSWLQMVIAIRPHKIYRPQINSKLLIHPRSEYYSLSTPNTRRTATANIFQLMA